MKRVVILTGAGISAESGLATFRDEDGLWARHRIEDVATPEAFARNPELVQAFYNARRKTAAAAHPNAAHIALARLQAATGVEVFLVTQNVDDLHEKAGAIQVLHMHGALSGALCHACGHRWPAPAEMQPTEPCPKCDVAAARPDVVWFGEIPYGMREITAKLKTADMFVSIGTSAQVYPAAGFAFEARRHGAHLVELNLEPSESTTGFDTVHLGPATQVVSRWVTECFGITPA